jgi:hypothetical protein
MTGTELAQRTESEAPQVYAPPSADMALLQIRDEHTDGWIPVIEPIMALANAVAGTDFVPGDMRDNAPAVGACILFGREIGVAPMHALQNVHIIDGRPSVSAEQMRAMVLAAGHEIAFGETSGAKCEIKGRRKGSTVWTVVEWTAAMADAAGLLGKRNWRAYRGDMLIARASAKLCRMIFSDVVRGMRTVEELEDETDGSAAAITGAKPDTGTTKVGRKASSPKTRAGALAGADVSTPAASVPSGSPRGEEIPPPPPPPAPTVEAGPVEATPGEGQSTPDTPTGPDPVSEELDEHGQEYFPEPEAPVDGPVTPAPKPMHPTQTKALQARFKGLGFTDEPDDREQRLRIAEAIVGHPVDTFRSGAGDVPLTYDEAQEILTTLAPARSRDDVIAIMVRLAQDSRAEDAGEGDQ